MNRNFLNISLVSLLYWDNDILWDYIIESYVSLQYIGHFSSIVEWETLYLYSFSFIDGIFSSNRVFFFAFFFIEHFRFLLFRLLFEILREVYFLRLLSCLMSFLSPVTRSFLRQPSCTLSPLHFVDNSRRCLSFFSFRCAFILSPFSAFRYFLRSSSGRCAAAAPAHLLPRFSPLCFRLRREFSAHGFTASSPDDSFSLLLLLRLQKAEVISFLLFSPLEGLLLKSLGFSSSSAGCFQVAGFQDISHYRNSHAGAFYFSSLRR